MKIEDIEKTIEKIPPSTFSKIEMTERLLEKKKNLAKTFPNDTFLSFSITQLETLLVSIKQNKN